MGSPRPFYPPTQPRPVEQIASTEPAWLMCDYCGMEIELGEDAIQIFQGVGGVGKNSGMPMVVDSMTPQVQQVDLHYGCVANYLVENYQEIVEMIFDVSTEEGAPTNEHYCASCDTKLDPKRD